MFCKLRLIFLAGFVWAGNVLSGELSSITPEDLERLERQGALVVDIRTPEEWKATGLIAGSHPLTFFDRNGHYDLAGFGAALSRMAPAPGAPVVLVCRSGHRSHEAGQMLAALWPDRRISHLEKGILEWMREGKSTRPPMLTGP